MDDGAKNAQPRRQVILPGPTRPSKPNRRMAQIALLATMVQNGYAAEQDTGGMLQLRKRDEDEPPQAVHAMTREKSRRLKQMLRQATKD